MESRIAIGLTKREAELYRSQGLFKESLTLYEQLLDDTPGIDAQIKSTIKSKIAVLKGEMDQVDRDQSRDLSEDEINLIRQNLGGKGTLSEVLLRASAFHETGLYTEAIREYSQLLGRACPPDKYAASLTDCLLAEYPETSFFAQLNQLFIEAPVKGLEKALLLYRCGEEMESRKRSEITLKLYKAAFQTLMEEIKKARRGRSKPKSQEQA